MQKHQKHTQNTENTVDSRGFIFADAKHVFMFLWRKKNGFKITEAEIHINQYRAVNTIILVMLSKQI